MQDPCELRATWTSPWRAGKLQGLLLPADGVGTPALNSEEGSEGPRGWVTSALISAFWREARGLDVHRASLGLFVPVSSRSSRLS